MICLHYSASFSIDELEIAQINRWLRPDLLLFLLTFESLRRFRRQVKFAGEFLDGLAEIKMI
ncbi:hypothetical protein H70357_33550 [Paenibacillus sp. FSL H7-0357]|nr:hypothetical protein H70357_33550 [Paenibacillus sp. FSL H7-0357]